MLDSTVGALETGLGGFGFVFGVRSSHFVKSSQTSPRRRSCKFGMYLAPGTEEKYERVDESDDEDRERYGVLE